MPNATARLQGQRRLMRTLSRIERQLAPRAMAQALNKTVTKVRQQTVKDARAGGSRLKVKTLKQFVRTTRRAKPSNPSAAIARRTPRRSRSRIPAGVPVSEPFAVPGFGGGQRFVRAITPPSYYRGKGWTRGRSRRWSRNLPIYSTGERPGGAALLRTLRSSFQRAATHQMRTFLPGEFRRQLATKVAKLRARQNRRT